MKRYNNLFTALASPAPTLPPSSGQLAYHPNGFFTEEEVHCIKKAVQALERTNTQRQTSTNVLFQDQLDELMTDIKSGLENSDRALGH